MPKTLSLERKQLEARSLEQLLHLNSPYTPSPVGRGLLFSLKGDITSTTSPAQRLRLMLSCKQPCFLLLCFLSFFVLHLHLKDMDLIFPNRENWFETT